MFIFSSFLHFKPCLLTSWFLMRNWLLILLRILCIWQVATPCCFQDSLLSSNSLLWCVFAWVSLNPSCLDIVEFLGCIYMYIHVHLIHQIWELLHTISSDILLLFFLPSSLPLSLSPSFSAISETPIMHVWGALHVLTCSTYMHPTPYFYFSLANSLFCLNVLLNPLSEFFTLIVVLFKSKISVLFFFNSFYWYSDLVSTLFSVFFNS